MVHKKPQTSVMHAGRTYKDNVATENPNAFQYKVWQSKPLKMLYQQIVSYTTDVLTLKMLYNQCSDPEMNWCSEDLQFFTLPSPGLKGRQSFEMPLWQCSLTFSVAKVQNHHPYYSENLLAKFLLDYLDLKQYIKSSSTHQSPVDLSPVLPLPYILTK